MFFQVVGLKDLILFLKEGCETAIRSGDQLRIDLLCCGRITSSDRELLVCLLEQLRANKWPYLRVWIVLGCMGAVLGDDLRVCGLGGAHECCDDGRKDE